MKEESWEGGNTFFHLLQPLQIQQEIKIQKAKKKEREKEKKRKKTIATSKWWWSAPFGHSEMLFLQPKPSLGGAPSSNPSISIRENSKSTTPCKSLPASPSPVDPQSILQDVQNQITGMEQEAELINKWGALKFISNPGLSPLVSHEMGDARTEK